MIHDIVIISKSTVLSKNEEINFALNVSFTLARIKTHKQLFI